MDHTSSTAATGRIPVLRAAAAGAAAFAAVFAICWVGARLPSLGATHAYLALFTVAPSGSTSALVEGLGRSGVFGAIAATMLAFFYNAFNFLGGRGR